jgi:hypothetical protein
MASHDVSDFICYSYNFTFFVGRELSIGFGIERCLLYLDAGVLRKKDIKNKTGRVWELLTRKPPNNKNML